MSIAFFIQASFIGAQAFLVREYKGVGTALLGNVSIALGFALLQFRDVFPDFLTIVVANTLSVLSPNLFYIAVSRFTGRKANLPLVCTIIALNAAFLAYFTYVSVNINLRIIIVSLTGAISTFILAAQLWKARHENYRFSLVLATSPFVIYGTFLAIRAVATIFAPPDTLFGNSPIETATYLLLFIISFMWTVGFMLMVSQRLQVDLTKLANTDSLTRVPNRYALQLFFDKELARIKRYGGEFSILLIDLDDFKQINDNFGHAVGDYVLIETAKIFQTTIRTQDIVGRWGGEEFLTILPSTSLASADTLAERLREQISETIIHKENRSLRLTVSIGIAHADDAVESMDTVLKKADDALYTAKGTKNTVISAK